jgi:hypothetical protein
VAVPAVVAVEGVNSNGTTVEQASQAWLKLSPYTNPLSNPSFATDLAGWTVTITSGTTVTPTRDTVVFDSAPASMKLNIGGTVDNGDLIHSEFGTFFPLNGRERIQVAAAMRTSNANLQVGLSIDWYTAAGGFVSRSATNDTLTIDAFFRRVLSASPPATAAQFKIAARVRANAAAATGDVWFDTFTVDGPEILLASVSPGAEDFDVLHFGQYP